MTNQQFLIVLLLLAILIGYCTPLAPLDAPPPLPHAISPVMLPRRVK